MIYLDYAAATPLSPKAFEAMRPYFSEKFFNPSAAYLPAKQVREDYEAAKDKIAHAVGAKGDDIVITAGATESVNLAFTVLDQESRAVISAVEHAAVYETAKAYDYDTVAVDKNGRVILDDLSAKIANPAVRLVSIALVNSEIGTIQPMSEIAEIVRAERARRAKAGILAPIYLHSDASQALSLLDISVSRLGVDMLTINAAKVYGPKGIGALWAAHNVELLPLVLGGGQERGYRSGTENVPLTIGFAVAIQEAKEHLNGHRQKYAELARVFREEVVKGEIEPIFLGNPRHQVANFIPLSFPGVDAERMIYNLEEMGVYVSTGAACAASKGQKSATLTAIGLSDEEIRGSLRITLGEMNDVEQVREAARLIREVAAAQREF